MTTPHRTVLAVACIAVLAAAPALQATDNADMTLYRSDSASLYASSGDGSSNDGYAVIREQRTVALRSGTQDLVLGDLPDNIDAEALALGFPAGNAQVISQRLLLGQGANAALTNLLGSDVTVLGNGAESLAQGTLVRADDDGIVIRTANSTTTLIRQYAGVRVSGSDIPSGSSLRLRVAANTAGSTTAVLSYPTTGIGWRAAYVATLQPGNDCRMQWESRASIANRSGRDWHDTHLTLIAGEPSFAKPSAPQPMRMKAVAMSAAAPADMPEQSTLADYRSYTLPDAVDLPNDSVSQVPLYSTRTLSCERTALYENGGTWMPSQPMLDTGFSNNGSGQITSTLRTTAFDSLPAGYLRVLTTDRNGVPQFIGEGRIDDTPKGSDATVTLGTAFDLRGTRDRTSFTVDKTGRTMDEAFRITLTNAGDASRVVTVREHPNRWRQWTLASSSSRPSQQTTDTLDFRVTVPANGKAVVDYAVHYSWTADDQPQS